MGGEAGYTGGFVDHYVVTLLYPGGLTRTAQSCARARRAGDQPRHLLARFFLGHARTRGYLPRGAHDGVADGNLEPLRSHLGRCLALLLFVVTSVGGIALVSLLLVKLPATYFCDSYPRDFWVERHPIIRWTGRVLKNVMGVAAVFLGAMLSLPGIPGPGVLLIYLE